MVCCLRTMRGLRIGVDVRCLMDGRRTGIEEYTLHLLRAMVRAAPHDRFVLFANSRRPIRLPAFSGPNVDVRVHRYPNTPFNLALKFLRRPALDALLGGVDVFFCPAFRLAPLSVRCPLVLTVHDLSFIRHPEFFSAQRRFWHVLMEPTRHMGVAERVIAVSHATAREVATLCGVDAARLSVVSSGISPHMARLPETDARLAAARRQYRLPARYILFLGTLEPRKNLDGLLRAYTSIRRAGLRHALVLAGVRGWIDDAFFRRVHTHPFRRDIVLTGFVDDSDKPAVYQLAELFVYPSYYEGFGFPPLEALAVGTPVVTAYNSAIPEIVGPWASLVNPYDPEELAAVIVERLRQPVGVPPEVSAAVRKRYDWARAADETLAVLRSVAVGIRERSAPDADRD